MVPKSDSSRACLVFMVVVLIAYTWYLWRSGPLPYPVDSFENAIQYLQEHGLSVRENMLTGLFFCFGFAMVQILLIYGFAIVLGLLTVGIFVTLYQAEAKKCSRYLLRLAELLMPFAFGYGIRLIASAKKGAGSEVLENASYLFFVACTLLCTFQRRKELERETRGHQVEAVGQVYVE